MDSKAASHRKSRLGTVAIAGLLGCTSAAPEPDPTDEADGEPSCSYETTTLVDLQDPRLADKHAAQVAEFLRPRQGTLEITESTPTSQLFGADCTLELTVAGEIRVAQATMAESGSVKDACSSYVEFDAALDLQLGLRRADGEFKVRLAANRPGMEARVVLNADEELRSDLGVGESSELQASVTLATGKASAVKEQIILEISNKSPKPGTPPVSGVGMVELDPVQ